MNIIWSPSLAVARPQRGAALLMVLLTLSVLLLLAGGGAQTALLSEKMLRNAQDRAQAFEAAEAALLDAEDDILRSPRAALFSAQNIHVFPVLPGCIGSGERQGLCLASAEKNLWQDMDFAVAGGPAVPYGRFTGNRYSATPAPRYVIELDRNTTPIAGSATDRVALRYRITAIGFNQRATTPVLLEKILQKE